MPAMFRPCIDLHEGKVKQIVGGTLGEAGLRTNFVSAQPAAWFAGLYRRDGLAGGHVIQLGPGNEAEARAALAAWPGSLQLGGGVDVALRAIERGGNFEERHAFGGLDAAIQAMHDHLRRSVFLPQPRGRGGWVESGIGPEIAVRALLSPEVRAISRSFLIGDARVLQQALGFCGLTARLNLIEMTPDTPARIIINERTGTIVATSTVRISRVAISHGSLTISITSNTGVSQPNAFSNTGQTMAVSSTQTSVNETRGSFIVINEAPSVDRLASALNALGVSTREMMAIFQTLKRSGALQADLVIN